MPRVHGWFRETVCIALSCVARWADQQQDGAMPLHHSTGRDLDGLSGEFSNRSPQVSRSSAHRRVLGSANRNRAGCSRPTNTRARRFSNRSHRLHQIWLECCSYQSFLMTPRTDLRFMNGEPRAARCRHGTVRPRSSASDSVTGLKEVAGVRGTRPIERRRNPVALDTRSWQTSPYTLS